MNIIDYLNIVAGDSYLTNPRQIYEEITNSEYYTYCVTLTTWKKSKYHNRILSKMAIPIQYQYFSKSIRNIFNGLSYLIFFEWAKNGCIHCHGVVDSPYGESSAFITGIKQMMLKEWDSYIHQINSLNDPDAWYKFITKESNYPPIFNIKKYYNIGLIYNDNLSREQSIEIEESES